MGMIGNNLAQGLISGVNIQDGTVDTPDLKTAAVTTAKLADWTQLSDSPLSAEQKSAWAAYRQALRDVTAQDQFPLNVVWPEQPTE